MNLPTTWPELMQMRRLERDGAFAYWLRENLFTFNWWLILIGSAMMWLVWVRLVDRRRIREIALYGSIVALQILLLDTLGTVLMLWEYPVNLVPVVPVQLGADLSSLPVAYMLSYQWWPNGRPFVLATATLATALAFVGGPVVEWLGIYETPNWHHAYSWPVYAGIAFMARWVTVKVAAIESRAQGNPSSSVELSEKRR